MMSLITLVVAAVASVDFWAAEVSAAAAAGSPFRLSQGEGASEDPTPGSNLLLLLTPRKIEVEAEEEAGATEESVEGLGTEEFPSAFAEAKRGRSFNEGDDSASHDSRFNEGKQFQGQVNRFGSGSQGNAPITSVVGSDPLAAVSMIQSYVDEVISKPTGDRPGYIMINSRNPAIINQLVAALTQRFGASSVYQDPESIQSIVGNSGGLGNSGIQAPNSGGNAATMPVFPFSNRFEKTSGNEIGNAENDLSEIEYIKQQLASIADLSISTGLLVNDTMGVQASHDNDKVNPTTPKTPVIALQLSNSSDGPSSNIRNTTFSENGNTEYANSLSTTEETETIQEVDRILASYLHENGSSINPSQGTTQDSSDPSVDAVSFTEDSPEINAPAQNSLNENDSSLKYLTTETPTLTTKSMHNEFHLNEEMLQKPGATKQGDLSENEVLATGYEDYYEYIDGELVLSPSKFMRRGGPFSKDDLSDNSEAAFVNGTGNVNGGNEDIATQKVDDVQTDLFGNNSGYGENKTQVYYKWGTNFTETQVYPVHKFQNHQNNYSSLGMTPVNPEVMEMLKGMEKEDLETLGLMEKLEMIPVLEENSGSTQMKMLQRLPAEVLNHLFTMNAHDLQTLNLFDDLRHLYHTQKESGLWHHNNTVLSKEEQVNKILPPEGQQLRPNFSAANFRQSDAPSQNIPPNFFPNRLSPTQHQHPSPVPQLSQEQQRIISQLPVGMQDVVSSIVMAVQASPTVGTTTQAPPYLPFPYPYPYPPYPYYPPQNFHPQQVPTTQQPSAHLHGSGSHPDHGTGSSHAHHNGHGAHPQHSAHGSDAGHGTHNNHGGHGSHAGHGAHGDHNNHGGHDSHTGHGVHGDHNNHGGHGSHTEHGALVNHINHGGHISHDGHNVNGIASSHTLHSSHSDHDSSSSQTNDSTSEAHGSGGNISLVTQRTESLPNSNTRNGTPRPAVVSEPIFSRTSNVVVGGSDAQSIPGAVGSSPDSNILANRVGELESSGIRDNDNSGHGTVGLLCRNEGTSGFCENRLSVGGVPNRPDRNQGLLQLRQDPAQMGNGRPSGSGIVNYRPPQQSSMQMGGPVINVVLPEVQETPGPVEDEIGPLIDEAPPEPASDSGPEMMDREEMNSLLQSLFSSPTLLLLGIIFATSAAYMAIAMEEQAAQQRFQQAQLAAAFGGQQPFFQGRRRRHLPDMWYPKELKFENPNIR
ncbi:uncharacterized protein LOC122243971 [Penaeus japonicus]|uniref:uncharacterized protein LOC122243971 n=1 Tax=Penaeus japonicus TaxID=27405 RepID=UPI001C717331|nr:uncharacterized protein LOC122243971 [Penaeus japonicus]